MERAIHLLLDALSLASIAAFVGLILLLADVVTP